MIQLCFLALFSSRETNELRSLAEKQGGSAGADEDWDLEVDAEAAAERTKYYRMPLPESQVNVVDNRGKLKACLYRLTQVNELARIL